MSLGLHGTRQSLKAILPSLRYAGSGGGLTCARRTFAQTFTPREENGETFGTKNAGDVEEGRRGGLTLIFAFDAMEYDWELLLLESAPTFKTLGYSGIATGDQISPVKFIIGELENSRM